MNRTRPMNTSSNNSIFGIIPDILEIFVKLVIESVGWILKEAFNWIWQRFFQKEANCIKIEASDIARVKQGLDAQDLGYSITKKRPFKLSEIDTKRHNLVVGASGWGKTNLINILMEHDLQKGRAVMFCDPKASLEAIEDFRRLCLAYGKNAAIVSEHYEGSIQFNPFRGPGVTETTSLIMRAFNWENDYYRSEAESALFKAVKKLHEKKQVVTLDKILALIDERTGKDREKIAGLIVQLERIVYSSFGKIFEESEDSLTLEDVRNRKDCFYVGLSTAGYGDMAKGIGKIFLGSLLYHSYDVSRTTRESGRAIENPISVYFDELGSILVPDFIDLLNKCRSSGIRITSCVQTLADIEAVSPYLKRQVWDCCNNIFVQKQSSHLDTEFICKSMGTQQTQKSTTMTIDGEEAEKGTIREAYEYYCHPNRLTELKVGQCILLRHNPKSLDLINIRNAQMSDFVDAEILLKKDTKEKGGFGV